MLFSFFLTAAPICCVTHHTQSTIFNMLHVKQGFMNAECRVQNAELRPINIKPCSKGICRAGTCSCRNVCTDFICQCSSLTRTVEGNGPYNVIRFCGDSVGCRGRQPVQSLCRYWRTRHVVSLPLLLATQSLTTDYFVCGQRINRFVQLPRNYSLFTIHYSLFIIH